MPRGKWDRKKKLKVKPEKPVEVRQPRVVEEVSTYVTPPHEVERLRQEWIDTPITRIGEEIMSINRELDPVNPDMGQTVAPPPYDPNVQVVGEIGAKRFIAGTITLNKKQIINTIGRSPQDSPAHSYLTAWIQYEIYETLLEIRDLLAEIKDKSGNV